MLNLLQDLGNLIIEKLKTASMLVTMLFFFLIMLVIGVVYLTIRVSGYEDERNVSAQRCEQKLDRLTDSFDSLKLATAITNIRCSLMLDSLSEKVKENEQQIQQNNEQIQNLEAFNALLKAQFVKQARQVP